MPVLHKYKDKDEYYILTSINGNVITFQLTPGGHNRLNVTGINSGERFGRALLLDLYRSGDAYTQGSGIVTSAIKDVDQIEFDFSDDPEPESMFPSCAACSSMEDLHLVEINDENHYASIMCSTCRRGKATIIDTSIPLPLVSRGVLSRILTIKGIQAVDPSVSTYQTLLDAEFASKWEMLIKRKPRQESLLDLTDQNQKKLI